jgi:hypothetical protein
MKPLRLLVLACATTAALSACNTGTDTGATNVERSADKTGPEATKNGDPAGDSVTSGLRRAPDRKVTGREQFENADQTVDRNHDGLAD